jgi:Fe-S oxidoreductase
MQIADELVLPLRWKLAKGQIEKILGRLVAFVMKVNTTNGIYQAPREVIASVTGVAPTEMERRYDKSFCCGAGGGRMWMEEKIGKRINVARVEQALGKDPGTICVCCPYCLTMFSDGLKDKKAEDRVQVLDLAEIVAGALR